MDDLTRRPAYIPPAPALETAGAASLIDPITIRGITLRNRVVMSPMCQYSSPGDGMATDWHVVHLGSRASGGAALCFTEATAVTRQGRISADDLGIWGDQHIEPLARVVRYVESQGALAGIQLAHAGRKGSRRTPWSGHGPLKPETGSWPLVGPSALAFDDTSDIPLEADRAAIDGIVDAFQAATERALDAGFKVIEIHSAHGYLLHEFLSPLSNQRTDDYGGSFDNRIRLLVRVAAAIRSVMPDRLPLFVRISCTDWVDGGWDIEESIELARRLKSVGVDLIDCSSGGSSPKQNIQTGWGYQVPFAKRIRAEAGIRTGAVGMIKEIKHAGEIIAGAEADVVLLGRALLRDPYWANRACEELGVPAPWPNQYGYSVRPPKPA